MNGPVDACPACSRRDNNPTNTAHPRPETVIAAYACGRCGQEWETSWWEPNETP